MNKILQIVFVVVGILVLAGGLLFAGTFLGMHLNQQAVSSAAPAVAFGSNGQNQVQPQAGSDAAGGMMNGGGRADRGGGNQPGGGQGFGPGGMMPGNNANQANLTPITVDEAKTAAQAYLTKLNIAGLEVGDVTIINGSADVVVKETGGGNGAFELIVDPRSKTAQPDFGVSMMWNLKYGGVLQTSLPTVGRGPMMGGAYNSNVTPTPAATSAAPSATPSAAAATPANVSADMPLSAAQAVTAAQTFLDKTFPGATASATPVKFYGYYSLSYTKDGQVVGILSINGFNGQVMPGMLHGMGMFGQGRP